MKKTKNYFRKQYPFTSRVVERVKKSFNAVFVVAMIALGALAISSVYGNTAEEELYIKKGNVEKELKQVELDAGAKREQCAIDLADLGKKWDDKRSELNNVEEEINQKQGF